MHYYCFVFHIIKTKYFLINPAIPIMICSNN